MHKLELELGAYAYELELHFLSELKLVLGVYASELEPELHFLSELELGANASELELELRAYRKQMFKFEIYIYTFN